MPSACTKKLALNRARESRRLFALSHAGELTDRIQMRQDVAPQAAVARRQTAEHVFGTLKSSLGTTPLLTKTQPRDRTEISLTVLAYNMKRMIKIVGIRGMMRAIAA